MNQELATKGTYGGGGGGTTTNGSNNPGLGGLAAVRIIYGTTGGITRAFPSTNTGNL
jgi:hypothetical protein